MRGAAAAAHTHKKTFLDTCFRDLPDAFAREQYNWDPTNKWDNKNRENLNLSSCVHGSVLPTLCTSPSDLPQSAAAEEAAG